MEEIDRLHDAYNKTDRVAIQRDAAARAQAQLQQETEAAIAEGRPTPAQLEAQRQKDHQAALKGEKHVESPADQKAMAESTAYMAGTNTADYPEYASISEALEASVSEALGDAESDVWARGGSTTIVWGIMAAEEGEGAEIGFAVTVDDGETGIIRLDMTEQRLEGWKRGLQNADGPKRFAFGITQKTFEVAAMETARQLLGAIQEVQEGLHLPGAPEPMDAGEHDARQEDQPTRTSVGEDDPPPMSEEAKAFIEANRHQQGPERVSYGARPEEIAQVGEAAKAFIQKNTKKDS